VVKILDIRETTASMASEMSNAYINFRDMTTSVVAIVTDKVRGGKPVIGYGFNSNGRYAVGGLLRERFIPRLLKADPRELLNEAGSNLDPERAWRIMMTGEKPSGHGERAVAVGTLDMALWDIVGKLAGQPLYRVLADRYNGGVADARVAVYAVGGYYQPGKDERALQEELRGYLDLGYTAVKMKIGGAPLADDLRRIEAALIVVNGDGSRLAVDANGRFDEATALAYGAALAPYGLKWYEEAGDPLDYAIQAALGRTYPPPLATGENLFSLPDARNLIRYGGMRPDRDILQFDPVLGYGLVEYLRILAMLREHGWSHRRCIPHGGHQMALHLAAGLGLGGNESYPGIFQPFGGFADAVPVVDGHVGLTETPGIGFEEKAALYRVFRALAC